MKRSLRLLQETLDMLIRKAVSLGRLHGHGILLRIRQIAKERLEIQPNSLYPELYRRENRGWLASKWGETENSRKAKCYRFTVAGRRRLEPETDQWNCMADVIAGILQIAPGEL
jgi:PadR family transcriptional regulator PadR